MAEVPLRKSVDDFVRQYGDRELDSFRDAQPMEAVRRVEDVVRSPQFIGWPRSRIQHWLEWSEQVGREASQDAIAVVQMGIMLSKK